MNVGNVTKVDNATDVNIIMNVDKVTKVDNVTDVSTVTDVDNVTNVDTVADVDTVTDVDNVTEVDTVADVDTVMKVVRESFAHLVDERLEVNSPTNVQLQADFTRRMAEPFRHGFAELDVHLGSDKDPSGSCQEVQTPDIRSVLIL